MRLRLVRLLGVVTWALQGRVLEEHAVEAPWSPVPLHPCVLALLRGVMVSVAGHEVLLSEPNKLHEPILLEPQPEFVERRFRHRLGLWMDQRVLAALLPVRVVLALQVRVD